MTFFFSNVNSTHAELTRVEHHTTKCVQGREGKRRHRMHACNIYDTQTHMHTKFILFMRVFRNFCEHKMINLYAPCASHIRSFACVLFFLNFFSCSKKKYSVFAKDAQRNNIICNKRPKIFKIQKKTNTMNDIAWRSNTSNAISVH